MKPDVNKLIYANFKHLIPMYIQDTVTYFLIVYFRLYVQKHIDIENFSMIKL